MPILIKKISNIAILLTYTMVSIFCVYLIKPHYFYSILLVLMPPMLLTFSWHKKHDVVEILSFSLITTLFFAVPIELIARLNNIWDVDSIFYRPFNLLPLENLLFAFINFAWVIAFDQYLFTSIKHPRQLMNKRLSFLFGLYLTLFIMTFSLFIYEPSVLNFSYFTLSLPILIFPLVFFIFKKPKLLAQSLHSTIFFAIILFVYEAVSLKTGSWWWPAKNYLFSTHLFGQIFPLDDVLIWYLISTPVLVTSYRYFVKID
ncbi:MAG: hypothetical protein WCG01_04955 [bacterium]